MDTKHLWERIHALSMEVERLTTRPEVAMDDASDTDDATNSDLSDDGMPVGDDMDEDDGSYDYSDKAMRNRQIVRIWDGFISYYRKHIDDIPLWPPTGTGEKRPIWELLQSCNRKAKKHKKLQSHAEGWHKRWIPCIRNPQQTLSERSAIHYIN